MNRQDPFERLLATLQDAALDDALWPAAASLIDEACGATGSSLIVSNADKVFFAAFYRRGEHRQDLERDYYDNYFHRDERVPRLVRLREGKLVRAASLYSAEELKTSATWNEAVPRAGTRNGLNVYLRGLGGLRVTWVIADPVAADWDSGRIRTIRRLLPHIRHFVHMRQALAESRALGPSPLHLFANPRLGVIHLDRRGRIAQANDRAGGLLAEGNALRQEHGFLRAWRPDDDTRLKRLVAAALPTRNAQGVGGSMMISRPFPQPALTLHIQPATVRQLDFGAPSLGALVVIVHPDGPTPLSSRRVGPALGLPPAESRVAVLLAEGRTMKEIAVLTGLTESTIRTYVKRIHRKLGVSRRADLVHLVLSVPGRGWRELS
ncbi:MAG: LuxR C-terminal-related transcriptional regulator [Candidatus Tectomicrobia bacterium]|nr:LuxR C-terminal-related transcriptional regulator [Candidatus Tectomicrobia bacterium]